MMLLARRTLGKRLSSVQPRATFIHRFCRTVVTGEPNPNGQPIARDLRNTSLQDAPELIFEDAAGYKVDWSKSFQGLSSEPFPKEIADILQSPVNAEDVGVWPGIPPCSLVEKRECFEVNCIIFFIRGTSPHA